MDSAAMSETRHNISIATPQQIPRDIQGSDNPIPLSPQWLLPKPGESKPGTGIAGENHFSSFPECAGKSDVSKSSGNADDIPNTDKKKDVLRPSLLDVETGRPGRWRDEERDTDSSVHRDRWREGDREFRDTRKVDKWIENAPARHYGETRRSISEQRAEQSNKEISYEQRRESKWNTRWGPDDKNRENFREKWAGSTRDGEIPFDKGLPHPVNHAKDEREGDRSRPWRTTSSQSRGRGDSRNYQSQTPTKQGPIFAYSRGRGENVPPTFSLGRGRVNSAGSPLNQFSSHSQSHVSILEKGESGHEEPFPLRYSRIKLLDVYRMTDMSSSWKLLDGLVHVPSLTQEESLEPWALCAPSQDELVILKGIDKGDIICSGAPQISKDSSVGRNSMDVVRRTKFGSREDLPLTTDGCKNECFDNTKCGYSNYPEGPFHEKKMNYCTLNLKMEGMLPQQKLPDEKLNSEENGVPFQKVDEVPINREFGMQGQGNASFHSGSTWRTPSLEGHLPVASRDCGDISADIRSSTSNMGWSQPKKNLNCEWEGNSYSSCQKDEPNWKIGEDPIIKRQLSGAFDKENGARKALPPSPEDLVLCYRDPQGEIQGPFSGSDIIGWYEAGYFSIDLPVRPASAPHDSPFLQLGDVMPHLRAKARPPPGFSAQKQNELADASSKPSSSTIEKHHNAPSETDMSRNETRSMHCGAAQAENRFLESLMSGKASNFPHEKFGLSEDHQGYGKNPPAMASLGAEDGAGTFLIAKKMEVEQQRSLPISHPIWPGRDAQSMVQKSDSAAFTTVHSNSPSLVSECSQQPSPSQNADLISILRSLSERTSGISNGVNHCSNFHAQSAFQSLQDKLSMLQGQSLPSQTPFGIQQPNMLQQNQSFLSNFLAQTGDPTGLLALEKLLSSGLIQDPQILTMLQQHYLLQLHSQTPLPTQQMSLLDKLLLLKQQQKQEEQQQLLRQQQQFFSHLLSERQSHEHFGEPSSGQSPVLPPQDLFQIGSNVLAHGMPDECRSNHTELPQVSQTVSFSPETSGLHLPHQIFGNLAHKNIWSGNREENYNKEICQHSSMASMTSENLPSLELVHGISQDISISRSPLSTEQALHGISNIMETTTIATSVASTESVPSSYFEVPDCDSVRSSGIHGNVMLSAEKINEVEMHMNGTPAEQQVEIEKCGDELSMMTELENVDMRETRKDSEKKSRKQKSTKSHSSQAKGASKAPPAQSTKQSEIHVTNVSFTDGGGREISSVTEDSNSGFATAGNMNSSLATNLIMHTKSNADIVNRCEQEVTGSDSQQNGEVSALQRAWKPAPGFKAKSLLEIQQEEQAKAQLETAVSDITSSISSVSISSPWAGFASNSDFRTSVESRHHATGNELTCEKSDVPVNPKNKKSQLHDLFAEDGLTKSKEQEMEVYNSGRSFLTIQTTQEDTVAADDFILARDNKKNRKKSKAKNVGAKVSESATSADMLVGTSPVEKGKRIRQVNEEKEALPMVPSGPSLRDFVVWKGETANTSVPAWSSDMGKFPKPTSLRDIQKEQGKKPSSVQQQRQIPILQKSQPNQVTCENTTSWSLSASSPSKAGNQIQSTSHAPQSKYKGDDDLFWGPTEQLTQESKQADFSQLIGGTSWEPKSTPVKATGGTSSGQPKSLGGMSGERVISSSPASATGKVKGKRNALTKHSEAMDFKNWCASESLRLTGTSDTSFLEFCLKQSRSEALAFLVENLGSLDPGHQFIDKFLNYKELLPADVIEMAFQSQNDQKVTGARAADVVQDTAAVGPAKCGAGKKKGKKGKKVSPAVLGFNVVSNRIMMGEIQEVED